MFPKNVFADRVYEQMLSHSYTVKTLANKIEVSLSTIYDIFKTKYNQPSTGVFLSLLEAFDCSADYMLGFLEFPPENVVYHSPLRTYGAKLRTLLQERGITQKQFFTDLNISSNLIYKWLNDQTVPSVEYLIKIAEYFDLTVDSLIERTH